MIPVTTVTIRYKAGFEYITPMQFKKVFTGSFTPEMREALKQKGIAFDLAYNRAGTEDSGKPIIRYPLVQYHTYKNTLEVTGLADGAGLLKFWMEYLVKGNTLKFNGSKLALTDVKQNTQYWIPQLNAKPQLYRVRNWKPFKSEYVGDKSRFDGIIWGNVHRLLNDLNIRFEQKPVIDILEYKRKKMSKGYKIEWITYDMLLSTNINLPQHIGLGHEVSLGSGRVETVRLL